ncbi:short-chain dehydrogenase/reductase [Aliidongia dinghuensis]|uniref:Short-chain dehydrogenase/reductase n=1 Tax=Aliidongia dinghuensis TaxID=1867774 RepID=A0A8J2YU10_9PROT|nr:oxidoreductase [Aliidongia dinghuensis]GGF21567.1 short-chain dehydrogenase/reductase [Aliidongia dinghuensis]
MSEKVVLITGVSSGIGRATAELLARKGYKVFGGVRSPEKARAIKDVTFVPIDVRDEASVKTGVETVLQRAGRIDVLINNAGYSIVGAVEETSPEEARALFDTNVFGVLRMSRAVLPAMRAQGSGRIINISSVLGFLPAPFMGLYAASKHAVEGLSESLDHEVRNFGIRVVLIQPSFTRTGLDTNAAPTAQRIPVYVDQFKRTIAAITATIKSAPEPDKVAERILLAIEEPYRMRRPADGRAALLSKLRRFMPAGPVDKSLRKEFALS